VTVTRLGPTWMEPLKELHSKGWHCLQIRSNKHTSLLHSSINKIMTAVKGFIAEAPSRFGCRCLNWFLSGAEVQWICSENSISENIRQPSLLAAVVIEIESWNVPNWNEDIKNCSSQIDRTMTYKYIRQKLILKISYHCKIRKTN
jgi:hypothetical protein